MWPPSACECSLLAVVNICKMHDAFAFRSPSIQFAAINDKRTRSCLCIEVLVYAFPKILYSFVHSALGKKLARNCHIECK